MDPVSAYKVLGYVQDMQFIFSRSFNIKEIALQNTKCKLLIFHNSKIIIIIIVVVGVGVVIKSSYFNHLFVKII